MMENFRAIFFCFPWSRQRVACPASHESMDHEPNQDLLPEPPGNRYLHSPTFAIDEARTFPRRLPVPPPFPATQPPQPVSQICRQSTVTPKRPSLSRPRHVLLSRPSFHTALLSLSGTRLHVRNRMHTSSHRRSCRSPCEVTKRAPVMSRIALRASS